VGVPPPQTEVLEVSDSAGYFRRFVLPGLAFKAVIIGGGYATGRELVEFFLPSGPRGGLLGMLLAMGIWSVVCTLTFLYAQLTNSYDYRAFFRRLLGPFWIAFELAYSAFILVMLSVFGAASGAIGNALFGWPLLAGTLCLVAAISLVVTFGSESVERAFKYVSFLLYGTYAVFLALAVDSFGNDIVTNFSAPVPAKGWLAAGITYSGYNLIGAVVILPTLRHLTSRKDAVIAGIVCGPLAMIPAIVFFVCMIAFYPAIGSVALPANFLLDRLHMPIFQATYQLMIFAALLESGSGAIHAINQRVAAAYKIARKKPLPETFRFLIAAALLLVSIFVASRFGLVALIAKGYRWLAYAFLGIYVLPLLLWGTWQMWRGRVTTVSAVVAMD
jgi:uncharacterized membrane protein YkvI